MAHCLFTAMKIFQMNGSPYLEDYSNNLQLNSIYIYVYKLLL